MKRIYVVILVALGLAFISANVEPPNASSTQKSKDYVSIKCKARHQFGEYTQVRRFPLQRVFVRDLERQKFIRDSLLPKIDPKRLLRNAVSPRDALLKPRIPSPLPYCKEISYDLFVKYIFANQEIWPKSVTLPAVRGVFVPVGNKVIRVPDIGNNTYRSPRKNEKFDGQAETSAGTVSAISDAVSAVR